MTPEERDRLTRVEEGIGSVRDDIKEIKQLLSALDARMTHLEHVAATGNGALRTSLYIGGILGWAVGLLVAVAGLFRGH